MTRLEQDGILPFLENWTDKDSRLPLRLDDLEFLYKMIRENKSKIAMEFGIGYSTMVILKALEMNRLDWDGNARPFKTLNNLFTLWVVEANNDSRWAAGAMENIIKGLDPLMAGSIHLTTCPVMVGTFRDMICHYYTHIPNILPDFIYLDGPDPKHANGNIRGIHFNHHEALPMAADLLFIEPILLPGTVILIDGRTSNARFLERNFQRKWEMTPACDMTILKLAEAPLKI